MHTKNWYAMLVSILLIFVVACAATPTPPAPRSTPEVVRQTVEVTRVVPAPTETVKFAAGSGKISDPYVLDWKNQNVTEVDFAFIGAFSGEITATQVALLNSTWYNYFGRRAVVGEVLNVPGFKAVALETATQQTNADQATNLLPFYFPPKGGKYTLVTLGGIAGGFYYRWDDLTKETLMQPGDSLAAAGACNVTFNTYQPALTNGYVVVAAGETFESLAERLTGDRSKGTELYHYNADRMRYKSTADLKPGQVLLTPTTWPPNTVTSFGLPRGVSLVVGGRSLSFKPEDPCIYLSASALALRDEALKRMDVPPLPPDVIAYRQRNFSDARTGVKIFAGDWKEGGGHGWFGDPWIARELMTKFHVLQSDMETAFPLANFASRWSSKVELEPGTNVIRRLEVDNVLIYRTSSDPPDKYRGGAFAIADFIKDPARTNRAVQAAYRGDDTPDAIPFGSLIAAQAAQFRNFNFAAAQIVTRR